MSNDKKAVDREGLLDQLEFGKGGTYPVAFKPRGGKNVTEIPSPLKENIKEEEEEKEYFAAVAPQSFIKPSAFEKKPLPIQDDVEPLAILPARDKAQILYNGLSERHSDMPYDFNEFYKRLATPGKAQVLYEGLLKDYGDESKAVFGETYEDFAHKLGVAGIDVDLFGSTAERAMIRNIDAQRSGVNAADAFKAFDSLRNYMRGQGISYTTPAEEVQWSEDTPEDVKEMYGMYDQFRQSTPYWDELWDRYDKDPSSTYSTMRKEQATNLYNYLNTELERLERSAEERTKRNIAAGTKGLNVGFGPKQIPVIDWTPALQRSEIAQLRKRLNLPKRGEEGDAGSWFNQFTKGLGAGFSWEDLITLGWGDLIPAMEESRVMQKLEDGEALTDAEMDIFDLIQLRQGVEGYIQSMGGLTTAASVGSGIAQMAPHMAGFAVGAGGAKAITAPLTKKIVNSGAKNWVKGLTTAAIQAVPATALTPTAYLDYQQRTLDQYFDESGQLHYDEDGNLQKWQPTSTGKRLYQAAVTGFLENFSEIGIGDLVQGPLSRVTKAVGEHIGLGKLYKMADNNRFLRFLRDDVNWNGSTGEFLEELFVNITQPLLTGEPEQLAETLSAQNLWETYLICAITGGAMNVSALSGQALSQGVQNFALKNSEKEWLKAIPSEYIRTATHDAMHSSSVAEMARALSEINWAEASHEDIEGVLSYVQTRINRQMLNSAGEGAQMASEFAGRLENIENFIYKYTPEYDAEGNLVSGAVSDATDDNVVLCQYDGGTFAIKDGDYTSGNATTPITIVDNTGSGKVTTLGQVANIQEFSVGDYIKRTFAEIAQTSAPINNTKEVKEDAEISQEAGIEPIETVEEAVTENASSVSVADQENRPKGSYEVGEEIITSDGRTARIVSKEDWNKTYRVQYWDDEQQNFTRVGTVSYADISGVPRVQSFDELKRESDKLLEETRQVAEAVEATAPSEEQPIPTAISRIPVDVEGNQLFSQAPVEDSWAALIEMNDGDQAQALDTAQQMLNGTTEALDKLDKASGNNLTVADIQRTKAEKKRLAEEQKYWSEVVAAGQTAMQPSPEPQTPVEFAPKVESKEKKNKQGNLVNNEGKLIVEQVASIDEITDEDFEAPTRSIQLPQLPNNIDAAIGANGKPVVIKRNIFERNSVSHSDLTPEQSRQILKAALYSPEIYGQNQKTRKPYNWVVVSVGDATNTNKLVLLEVNNSKENVEVVHWHYIDQRGLEKLKRQAEREDGQLLILPSTSGEEVGALADPTLNQPSTDKDTTSIPENQIEGQEVAETPSVDAQIEQAEQETNPTPTDAQKEAGNYKKGHIKIDGFDITIETPKGVERSGVDEQGNPWSVTMNNTYGYIRGTEGVDGDHIDLFLSDNLDDWNGEVFVVDQVNPDGSFDEHKVMYGFNSIEEAQTAYLSNYSEGWQGLGAITGTSKEEFQKWIASSHRKTKPFAEYKNVKTIEGQAVFPESSEQISLEDYLSRLGLHSPISDYMDDKIRNPRGLTESQKKQLQKDAAIAAEEYQTKRGEAIRQYGSLVAEGKITPPSNLDRLLAVANGHPDNESTQAARRALKKRGYNWQTGRKTETTAEDQPTEPIPTSEQLGVEDEFAEAVAKQGYIERLPKKTKYSVWNYTGDKSLRAIRTSPNILEGVLYDNGFRIASDGQVLVKEKSSYPAEYEGTTRMRDGVRTDNGVKYPNYKILIEDYKGTKYKKMDFEDFGSFLNAIEEKVTTAHKQDERRETRSLKDALKYTPIAIKLPTGETWWGSLATLQKFALAAKQFGADKVYFKNAEKMFLAKNSKGEVALVMPVFVDSYLFEGSTRYYYEPSLELQSSASEQSPTPTGESKTNTPKPILASKEPAPTASKGNSSAKIEDFGEKIGGARKDLVREKVQESMKLSKNDLAKLKDPDKILSRTNIIKYMREGQLTPDDASTLIALNMATRGADSSFSKPIMMNKYRQCALDCLEGRDIVVEITDADVEAYMSAFAESIRSRSNFEHSAREALDVCLSTFRDYKTTYEAIDYPEVNRNVKTAYIEYHKYNDTYRVVKGPKAARGYRYSTLTQAIAKFKSEYPEIAEVTAKSNATTSSDDKIGHLYISKDERGYYRIKSRLIPGNIYLSGRLNSKKVAEQHLKDNADKLIQREQKMAETLMGSNIGMVERKGKDYRKGKDVTPQDFLDTFGVRGVEFGNWVPQAERQLYLNKSYDAIMDLCAAVGISPRAFSLGGSLGLAFGSRGKSRALAHYEPLKEVINLTRLKGAGSLAHEWFHALDNYMAKQVGGDIIQMATHNYRAKRPEVAEAFRSLVRRMNELPYTNRSKKAGDYWGEVWERAARLFQSYIYNKLAESNTVSPLLVRGDALFVESDIADPDFEASSYPYPSAEENDIMKPYFDSLFDTIQEREEDGKTILYQVEEGDIATATANITTDEIIDLVRASGVEVETATPETIVTPAETFYSNAEFAVRNIKQEKATPEQWLKMIEKNGGLKAGEDKWLGLSDWLKESKAKTLTKQEVLDYINANKIVVEDVEYGVQDYMSENDIYESDEYRALEESLLEYEDETPYIDKEKFKELRNEDEDFVDGFDVDYWGEQLLVKNPFAAARYLGISNVGKRINETRLQYTTNGLTNKREIALVVPTIESWGKSDDVHFGDAGEGRAVAWVRFGDAEAPVRDANYIRLQEIYDRLAELEMKVGSSEGITMEEYEERARLREERDNIPESGNERILVIDEIQSKRHQEGREKGYYDEQYVNARLDVLIPRMNEAGIYVEYDPMARSVRFLDSKTMKPLETLTNPATDEQKELMQQFRNLVFFNDKVKPAPFEKNWHEVAMKRILRYAAENGYDKVAWTTGDQQAERYNIGGVVDSIESNRVNDNERMVHIFTKNENKIVLIVNNAGVVVKGQPQYKGRKLFDILGKELAEKVLSLDVIELSGEGLRIGGEGMKGFYDKILPNFMNKYGKKWGVKVGEVTMPDLAENNTMHSVDITPAMRESVLRGQPLFLQEPTAENPKGAVYGWMTNGKIYLTEQGLNPETPIHEYTHVWDMVCKRENPELWAEGVKLMKQTPLWEDVRNNPAYEKIADNEDLLASEVHARLVAPGGANILADMLEKKTARPTLVGHLRTWVSKFWRWLKKHLLPDTKLSIADFANMPLKDLAMGRRMNARNDIRFRSGTTTTPSPLREGVRDILNQYEEGENYAEYGTPTDVAERVREYIKTYDGGEDTFALEDILADYDSSRMESRNLWGERWDDSDEVFIERLRQFANVPDIRFRSGEDYTPEEQEIVAKAKADGTYLKAPNGKPTNLTPRQWVHVRTKAFKKWFGDWLLAAMTTPIHKSKGSFNNLTEAEEWAKANLQGKSVKNLYANEEISIGGKSIKEMLAPKFAKNVNEQIHMSALRSVLDFIATGIPAEIHKDTKGRGFDVMRLYNAIEIDGVVYRVKSTVRKVKQGDRYYTYEVQEMELLEDTQDALGLLNTDNGRQLNSNNSITGAKLLKGVKKTNSNEEILSYSQVVDANGEPMVVYHGSNWKGITSFDRSQSKRRRSGLKEYGHFFTTNRALAEMYSNVDNAPEIEEELARLDAQIDLAAEAKDFGKLLDLYTEKERITRNLGGRVYEVFLNMRDVAEFDAEYQAENGWNNLKADVGYKTAVGRDAVEAYAGQNTMTGDKLRNDGIIARNILDMFVGTENKEALKPYFDKFGGDVFLVFDPQNIKSATENIGTFDANNPDIRYRESDGTSYPASKQQMADAARELASQLNTPVEVYTEIEEITDPNTYRQRRMRQDKGWWTSNGTIGINISRHDSVADVEATILHEMVGHKGLREVVGSEEAYNELLNRVWNHLTPEEQKSWSSRYANRYEAMDEYLATLAEGNVTLGVWDRIVGWFRELLNKVFGRRLQISDRDIAYLLWKSRTRLQKPKSADEAIALFNTDKKYREEAYRSRSSNQKSKEPRLEYLEKFTAPKITENLVYYTSRNGFTDKLVNEDNREGFLSNLFLWLPQDYKRIFEQRNFEDPLEALDKALRLPQKKSSTATLRGILGEKLYEAVLAEVLPPFWNAKYVNDILRRYFKQAEIRAGRADAGNTYLDKGNPLATFEEHGKVGSNRLRRGLLDNAEPLKKFIDRIVEAFGVDITDANNIYSAVNRWTSRAKVKLDRFQQRYVQPLLDAMTDIQRKAKKTYDEIALYVTCKHAIERHNSGITTFPTGEDVELKYPQWNYHYAHVVVEQFEKVVPKELVDALWAKINLMNKATLDNAVATGNLSLDSKSRILSHNWKYYVPLMNWDMSTTNAIDPVKFYDFGDIAHPKGVSSSVYFHRAEERTTRPGNPIANMMQFGNRAIISGENNKMKQVLFNLCADAEAAAHKNGKHPDRIFEIVKNYAVKDSEGKWRAKPMGEEITDEFLQLLEHSKKVRRTIWGYKRLLKNPDLSPAQKEYIFDCITRLEEEESVKEIYRGEPGMPGELPLASELDEMRCVHLYINGARQTIKFADPLVAMAVNGQLTSAQGEFARFIGWLTRTLSGLFTTYNPAFVVSNMLRDFRHSFRMHWLDSSYGGVRKFTRNMPLTYGAIWRKERGRANPLTVDEVGDYDILHSVEDRAKLMEKYGRNRVLDTLYDIFEEQGGLTGYVFNQSFDEIDDNLRRLASRNALKAKHASAKRVIEGWEATKEWYDALASVSEGSTRFATFLASLENGSSTGQAAQNAKDITVNFNRKGEWSKVLGSLYLFFNASMQAANQEFQAAKKNPPRTAVYATYRTATAILNSALLAYALDLINGADDDERNDIEVPMHVRLSNTVIPLFGGKYIKIPHAQGAETLFNSLGTYLYEWMAGNITPGEFSAEMAKLPFDIFSPLALPAKGNIMRSIMPTILTPFYDIIVNEDYLGRPIHKERYSDATPTYQLGLKNTPEFFVEWAKIMNSFLGGNEIERGAKNKRGEIVWWKEIWDFNPSDMHHVLQYYAGGSLFGGKFFWNIVNTIDYVYDMITEGKSDIDIFNELPIVRRFVGEAYVPSKSGDYYDLWDRLKVQHEDFKKYKDRKQKTGEPIPDYILRDEHFYQYMNNIHKVVKRNQEIANSKTNPEEQEEIQKKIQDIMFEAIYLDDHVEDDLSSAEWKKQFSKAREDYNKKYRQK